MAGFDGIDPTKLKEMTEIELANSLSAEEIVKHNMHFSDPQAKAISMMKVLNKALKVSNEFLDEFDVHEQKQKNIYVRIKELFKW